MLAQKEMENFRESYEREAEEYAGETYRILEKISRLAEIFLQIEEAEAILAFEVVIDRVSEEWDYVNAPWHYETSRLKVNMEERETSDIC